MVSSIPNYNFILCNFQGTPVKDVKLPTNPALENLLLDKHAEYIEAFERNKDDFVSYNIASKIYP